MVKGADNCVITYGNNCGNDVDSTLSYNYVWDRIFWYGGLLEDETGVGHSL